MKRKCVALIGAAAMLASMCGSWTVMAEESEESVTITWYRKSWSANEDEKLVEAAINEYIEPLIGVKVNVLNSCESTEISLALAAGDDIDLWWDAAWNNMNNFIAGNSAYDLTDVIDNYPALKESIPELVWDACKQNGKLWYIPVYKEAGEGYSLTVPTAQVEKYGWDLSSITELKDIEPMLEDLYNDGAEAAYIAGTSYADFILRDLYANMAETSDGGVYAVVSREDPSTVVNFLETPEYEEFLNLMHSWFEKGYINEGEASENMSMDATVTELRNTGDNGFCGWVSVPTDKSDATSRFGMDVEVVPLTKNYADTDSAAGSVYMVNAKTEKLDAVMKFVELLSTDETLANLALYGIEGEHYNLVDGRVELISDSGYYYPGNWIVCSAAAPTMKVGEPEDKVEKYTEFNENLEVSVTNGFRFDKTNVEAEVTALDGVFAEYLALLSRGIYDPEEYLPKFQEAAKNAGIDTVIAEIQIQWDAFFAEQ